MAETAVKNLGAVKAQLEMAARAAGREPSTVTLIAVSKTFSAEAVEPLLAAGHRHFGENRVQEAQGKWPVLRARYPDLVLHLIGPLQTNKVRDAVQLFDVIHTLDRPRLALVLTEEIARAGRAPTLLVQVNIGEEPQKAGVPPAETVGFVHQCQDVFRLDVDGLMCIPPAGSDPGPHFESLARLAAEAGVDGLSMGMSSDFEAAIAAGATHVRVGSAIFGVR